MTLISRILGLIRDIVLAALFGAVSGFDAFIVALKIPNFLRRLFAEGAFSQAFVPVLSEYKTKEEHFAVQRLVSYVAGNLMAVLLAISIIASLAAPAIIYIFAHGFAADPSQLELASQMLRITFPYILFISLTAFAGGILNSYSIFAPSAITPVLFNLSLIGCALFLAPHLSEPVKALAYAVLIAGILQLAFQFPFLKKLKMLPKPQINFRDPGVKKVLRLMLPALLGSSVAQISLLVDTLFASFLVSGSISWLYYSDRLMGFPLGIIGVALATVILPHLARTYAENSPNVFSDTLDWAIRSVLLFGIPSALGLALLAGPLMVTLFHYGQFSEVAVLKSSGSLMAYALGLPAFMMVKIIASAYYARQDVRTPVKIALIALLANLILNFAFILPLAHVGLALATSLASLLNVALLTILLLQRKIYIPAPGWTIFLLRLTLASIIMVVFIYYFNPALTQWFKWHLSQRIFTLFIIITGASATYFGSLGLLGMRWERKQKRAIN